MATSSITSRRARLAALGRHRSAGDPEITEAARDLKEAVAEDFIRRLVAEAPPLSDDQRTRLASLLAPALPPAPAAKCA